MAKAGPVYAMCALLVVIAAVLAWIAAARPNPIWASAKVQHLVRMIGEAPARGVFFALAGINLAGALFILFKLRTGP